MVTGRVESVKTSGDDSGGGSGWDHDSGWDSFDAPSSVGGASSSSTEASRQEAQRRREERRLKQQQAAREKRAAAGSALKLGAVKKE